MLLKKFIVYYRNITINKREGCESKAKIRHLVHYKYK